MTQWIKRTYHRHLRTGGAADPLCRTLLEACWDHVSEAKRQRWPDAQLLVVDAEMSSLDWRTGELLSLGWVVIERQRVQLSSAQHCLLQPIASVGESATIHHLRDCELDGGLDQRSLLQQFLTAAKGRVLVFHHAPLDIAFLDAVCRRYCGAPLLLPVIDTMLLEKRQLERRQVPLQVNSLRLSSCRTRYHLPDYPAHNALVDALATAELLLAQLSQRQFKGAVGSLVTAGMG